MNEIEGGAPEPKKEGIGRADLDAFMLDLSVVASKHLELKLKDLRGEAQVSLDGAFNKYHEGMKAVDAKEKSGEDPKQIALMRQMAKENLDEKVNDVRKRLESKLLV